MKNLENLDYQKIFGTFYKHPFTSGLAADGKIIDCLENHLLNLNWETKRAARHEYFMSDKEISYSYGKHDNNDVIYNAQPFTPEIRDLNVVLNQVLETNFNACFLNKYDNEKQHLGWHADQFETADENQPIAVVSFGAEREIWLKEKDFKGEIPDNQKVLLERGSLFIMPPGYQDLFFHRIPKHSRPCGWRISLTFRSFN